MKLNKFGSFKEYLRQTFRESLTVMALGAVNFLLLLLSIVLLLFPPAGWVPAGLWIFFIVMLVIFLVYWGVPLFHREYGEHKIGQQRKHYL